MADDDGKAGSTGDRRKGLRQRRAVAIVVVTRVDAAIEQREVPDRRHRRAAIYDSGLDDVGVNDAGVDIGEIIAPFPGIHRIDEHAQRPGTVVLKFRESEDVAARVQQRGDEFLALPCQFGVAVGTPADGVRPGATVVLTLVDGREEVEHIEANNVQRAVDTGGLGARIPALKDRIRCRLEAPVLGAVPARATGIAKISSQAVQRVTEADRITRAGAGPEVMYCGRVFRAQAIVEH